MTKKLTFLLVAMLSLCSTCLFAKATPPCGSGSVPANIVVSQTTATCNGLSNPNYNGVINITSATNASKFGISSLNAGTYNGAAYVNATSISSYPATVKTNVPNTGGTYILRVYGSDATCFTDVSVTVSEVLCTVNCPNTQFPNGSSITSVDWVVPPYNSLKMANFYQPSKTNPENPYTMYAPGNLTIQTQNLTDYTAFCSDITKTLYINNNYTDYKVVPLEYLAKENAGVSGTPAEQIPDGGIGPVRAGMLRYLVDKHFVSNNSTDAGWSTNNIGMAFQIAVWEITHDQYNVSNINFTVKNATTDGLYFDYSSNNSTGKAILDSAENWLQDIQNKSWDWTAYVSRIWHPVGINSPSSQDLIIAEPIALCPVCSKPDAGSDQSVCIGNGGNVQATLTGTPSTFGTWSALVTNPSGASLGSTSAGVATATISAIGTYSFVYTVPGGCNDTVQVISKLPSTSSTNASICSGDSYSFNGNTYYATGTYTYHTTNAVGCDSAANLVLTVKATSTSTTSANICNGSSYTFNGTTYSTAGTYTYSTTNSVGCDSTATLVLTVNSSPSAPVVNVSQPVCGTTAGSITITAPIGSGNTYSIDGSNYQSSPNFLNVAQHASYNVTVKNTNGCISAATVAVVNNAPVNINDFVYVSNSKTQALSSNSFNVVTGGNAISDTYNISFGDGSTSNIANPTKTYSESGIYNIRLIATNVGGCTDTSYQTVVVTPASVARQSIPTCGSRTPLKVTQTAIIAPGLTDWSGQALKTISVNKFNTTLGTLLGVKVINKGAFIVDSKVEVTGNMAPGTKSLVTMQTQGVMNFAGPGFLYGINPATILDTFSATGFDGLKDFAGTSGKDFGAQKTASSDSTIFTDATILNSYKGTGSVNFTAYTNTQFSATIPTGNDTMSTSTMATDTAIVVYYYCANADSSISNISVCSSSLPYIWNSNTYNAAGSYQATLTNVAGGDSVAILNLTVKSVSTSTTNASICTGNSYTFNGNTYHTAGTYTAHLTNAAGCDSTATLVLTIGSPSGIIVSQTAATCNSLNNPNYDGIVSITAATNASRFGISTLNAGTYNGAAYANATNISSYPTTVKSNVPNTGGTYILRVYGSDATCYTDVSVTVSEVLCTVNCPNTQFPNGSSLSSVDWVIPPSNSLNMANFYQPSRINPENPHTMYAPGNLTIQTQNLTNYTAFCSDITKTLYINNNYTDYRVVPLEYLAKENAGIFGTPAQQIPDGGIGPIRAGMLRYLVDQHFVSNNSTDAGWSANNTGIAFQIAIWEITHDQYNVANINFTVKNATSDGLYFDYASNNATGKAILDSAEKWLNDVQIKTWDWTAYTSTRWHPVGINSPSSQDLIIAEPIALCPVPGGGVSSGGTGGTESKSLGNAISQLFINNVTNSINSKIDYAGLHAIKPIAESIQVMGNSGVSLQNLLPATHAVETALGASVNVYATSPTNLTGITNALEVQAQDYTVNTTCKAVAFATKTSSSIYGHTKPICDRLKEAELQDIQKVTINNINFMQYKLLQSNGDMEYAISFTAGKNLNSSFYDIQSKWLLEDFNGYDTMYNFQIWGINPQVVNNMVADVLNNLNYSLPYYQLTYAPVPQTYILSHRRNQSAMNVTIKNNTNATTANLQVTEYMNELSAAIPAKVIPVYINPNGITTVSFDMADHYQADIKMLDANNNTVIDEVYSNDGSWDISYNNITTSVQEFIVSNDGISASKDEYRLFRNVTLKATTSDFVSVYKLMKAAALPRDISQYNTLKFTANATGAGSLKITFVKNTITDWNSQYSVTIPTKQGTQDYSINYTDLLSNGLNGMDASDVTAITISFIVNNSNTALNACISNAKLVRSTIVITPSVDTKMSIYPNPVVNNTFSCSFNSLRAEALTLKVIETGTGRILYSQIVNSNVGNNTALITLPKESFLTANNYIVTLQGDYSKYDVQKVVIKN